MARVVFYLVSGHPFRDGNHRTAAAYLLTLMLRIGKQPIVSDAQIAEFLRGIDRNHRSLQAVERWVADSFTG